MSERADHTPRANAKPHRRESADRWSLRVSRAIDILRLLLQHPQEARVRCLCERYGVSRRTILRDIAILRSANVPVRYIAHRGHFRLDEQWRAAFELDRTAWPLSWEESVTVFAALQQIRGQHPATDDLARGALSKLVLWMRADMGDRAGSVLANARLVAENPRRSVHELHRLMSRFWLRTGAGPAGDGPSDSPAVLTKSAS